MTGTAQQATPASPEAGSAAPESGDQVPDGTVDDVLAWVGDDPTRARAAYDAELSRAQPRSTLLAELDRRGGGT